MRKIHDTQIALVAGAFLLCATGASGVPLGSASFSFSSSLSHPLLGMGVLSPPPISIVTSAGSSAGVAVTATLGANVIAGTASLTGVTTLPPINSMFVTVTGHAAGIFTAGGGTLGNFGGAMTMEGRVKIKAYSGLVTLMTVPLSVVGNPGATRMWEEAGGGVVNVTGAGWTTGLRTFMIPATTTDGGTQTPRTLSLAGADLRTPGGAGTLVLITPTAVRTNLFGDIPSFGVLTLNYVPEPGTLLLVGSGAALLGVLGRRRKR